MSAELIPNVGAELDAIGELGFIALQALEPERLFSAIRPFHQISPNARTLIVFHGDLNARRSLLILDPNWNRESLVVPSSAWDHLLLHPSDNAKSRAISLRPGLEDAELFLQEAALVAQPRVIVAGAPEMVSTCVPRPPWKVSAGIQVSTAGVLARSADGIRGVTVCYHGAGDAGTVVSLTDGTSTIESEVSLASKVLDTCFVPIPENFRPALIVGVGGILENRAPGRAESHSFQGFQRTEAQPTEILAVDWGIPFPTKGRQLCVQTRADTNTGDSGTALVNSDDRLVGFAFQRTPYGAAATVEFSDWIWAASALNELSLEL